MAYLNIGLLMALSLLYTVFALFVSLPSEDPRFLKSLNIPRPLHQVSAVCDATGQEKLAHAKHAGGLSDHAGSSSWSIEAFRPRGTKKTFYLFTTDVKLLSY